MDPTPPSTQDLDDAPTTIAVSFAWDLRRALGAARAQARLMVAAVPYPIWLLVVALLALITASIARALYDGHTEIGAAPLILTTVALLMAPAALFLSVQLGFQSVFAVPPGEARMMEWHIDEGAIRVMTQASDTPTRIRWSEISRLVKTPTGYLLYIHPTLPTWLPRDVFEDEDDRLAFEAMLRRKLGPGARAEV